MPEAPAATSVLSTTSTSSPFCARCQAVDRPWTPAPMTRVEVVAVVDIAAYRATGMRYMHGRYALASARSRPPRAEISAIAGGLAELVTDFSSLSRVIRHSQRVGSEMAEISAVGGEAAAGGRGGVGGRGLALASAGGDSCLRPAATLPPPTATL